MSKEYLIVGKVVTGDGRGRKLGFPTANLQLDDQHFCPGEGVYACLVEIVSQGERRYGAVCHIGPRPTFVGAGRSCEVHLIDWPDRELYGEKLKVFGFKRLRGIKKYSSPMQLTQAIAEDIKKAKRILWQQKGK